MTRAGRRASGESGLSLIEAVIAMFVLATAIVALIGGLGTSIIAADSQRKNVTADAYVRSWAEKLQGAGWVSCATPGTGTGGGAYSATTLVGAVPSGFAVPTITSLDYWNGDSPATYGSTCASGALTDTAQRITLVLRSNDGRGGARVQIVKRK